MNKIKMNRVWAMPNKHTFKIKPIKELLDRYVKDGVGWVDPFAGYNSPAQWTNDLNPKIPTKFHLSAEEFCKNLNGQYNGILFDPPYSYRQVKECYEGFGLKPTQLDTSTNFYNRVMNQICDKIIPGGYAISFGWNSVGFGKKRGYKIIEAISPEPRVEIFARHRREGWDAVGNQVPKEQQNILTQTSLLPNEQ